MTTKKQLFKKQQFLIQLKVKFLQLIVFIFNLLSLFNFYLNFLLSTSFKVDKKRGQADLIALKQDHFLFTKQLQQDVMS